MQEVLKDLKSILNSKLAKFVAAVILALIAGTLFWIGGYENPTTQSVFEQSWSWRNSMLQQASVVILALATIPIFSLVYDKFVAPSYSAEISSNGEKV